VGQRAVLLALPGFVLTVLVGLATIPRRRSGPFGRYAPPPFELRWSLFLIVPAILGALYLFGELSRGGVPDLGDGGLVLSREHYMLISRGGIRSEVARWHFVVLGLLFHTMWFGGGAFATWLVFLSKRPSR
jgi:hypothetical protein